MHSARLLETPQASIKLPKLGLVSSRVYTSQKTFLALSKPASRSSCKPKERETPRTVPRVNMVASDSLGTAKSRSRSPRRRQRMVTWPSVQYRLWLEASNLPYHEDLHERHERVHGNVETNTYPRREGCDKPTQPRCLDTQTPVRQARAHKQASGEHTSKPAGGLSLKAESSTLDGCNSVSSRIGREIELPLRPGTTARLPSIMGKNTLEHYLQSYEVDRVFGSQKTKFAINPLTYRPKSGLHCQLLELRTHTRQPMSCRGGPSLSTDTLKSGDSFTPFRPSRRVPGSVHPCLADSSPPPSPPSLDSACRVTTYISTHHKP